MWNYSLCLEYNTCKRNSNMQQIKILIWKRENFFSNYSRMKKRKLEKDKNALKEGENDK